MIDGRGYEVCFRIVVLYSLFLNSVFEDMKMRLQGSDGIYQLWSYQRHTNKWKC